MPESTITLLPLSRSIFINREFEEILVPTIWEQSTFTNKAGTDILNKMYTFQDKKSREICLIPEVTAIIQELYNASWVKDKPKPIKLFYVSRCYRYDRPQMGRYREFTQFGVEILGGNLEENYTEVKKLAQEMIPDGEFYPLVKRGLSYYIDDGFEIEFPTLGAQKQVLGGGKYKEGCGFAIGIDRLMLV